MLQIPDDIPRSSGIYFFKDSAGRNLYIGKAINLKNRLSSYWNKQPKDIRIMAMLEIADSVDWQETTSEIEALILEAKFIKKYKPRFNISLRDDKGYSVVNFTKEEYPKVIVSHREKEGDSSVGPFTSGQELRSALKVLRKLFPYCTCKQKHNRKCLNAHIGKCLGFCCLKAGGTQIEKKSYTKMIKTLKDILSGKKETYMSQFPNVFANTKIIREITNREGALEELSRIFHIKKPNRIEGYDISNIQGVFATGSMVVFENGHPNTSEYRKFKIMTKQSPDDTAMMREMLHRRFSHKEWPTPDVLLIDGGKGQLNAVKSVIGEKIPILSIAKGKEEIFSTTLSMPVALKNMKKDMKNLILHIDSEAHRFAINYYRSLHKKSLSGTLKRHV